MSDQLQLFEVKETEKPRRKYKYFFRAYKIAGCFDVYVSQVFEGYKSLSGEIFGTFDNILTAYENAIKYSESITKQYPTTWLKSAARNIKNNMENEKSNGEL